MRLRDIQQVLANTIDELEIRVRNIEGSNDKEIHEPQRTREAIEALESTGLFQEEVKHLLSVSVIVNNVRDPIVIPLPVYQEFHKILSGVRNTARVFLGVLDEFIGEQDQNSIGVKIPPRLDLEQASEVFSDLNMLLEQSLVNPDTDGTITLQGFDRGSEWLEIGLGSFAALTFFSKMVQVYFNVKESEIEIEKQKEQVRGLRIDNDWKERAYNSLAQELETSQNQERNALLGDNNDQNERIKHSFNLLKKWMDRGLQILPSRSAPDDIKLSFSPPPKQVDQMGRISSQQEEEEEEKNEADTEDILN